MSQGFKAVFMAHRKIIAISLAAILIVTGVTLGIVLTRTPRSAILRIANWDYFLDESLITRFEREWETATGNRIRVDHQRGGYNESFFRELDQNRRDFDLVIPSEYMVEKMIAHDMLKPLDLSRLPALTATETTPSGAAVRVLDPTVFDAYITNAILNVTGGVHFAIPYAYGTLGIVYDTSVSGLGNFIRANGWRSLFAQNSASGWLNETHANQNSWRQSVKNIGRDTYTIALLAYYQAQLESYIVAGNVAGHEALMHKIFSGVFDAYDQFDTAGMATLRNTARDVLMTLPRDVMFEGPDQLLNDMYRFAGTAAGNQQRRAVFGIEWSVSAVFAKYMNVSEGFQETSQVGFYVPQVGTNLWINSLVIPNAARNVDAAYAFINFIKSGEVALQNQFTHCGATPILEAAQGILEMLEDTITFTTATRNSTRSELELARDAYLAGGDPELTLAEANAEIDAFIAWQSMLMASFPREFGTLERNGINLGGIFRYFSGGLDVQIDLMLNGVRTATSGSGARPAR